MTLLSDCEGALRNAGITVAASNDKSYSAGVVYVLMGDYDSTDPDGVQELRVSAVVPVRGDLEDLIESVWFALQAAGYDPLGYETSYGTSPIPARNLPEADHAAIVTRSNRRI